MAKNSSWFPGEKAQSSMPSGDQVLKVNSTPDPKYDQEKVCVETETG